MQEDDRQVQRPPLSLDAHGGDWLKPPVRLGDDGAIYIRDPAAVSGTRRIERGTAVWREQLANLDPYERERALLSSSRTRQVTYTTLASTSRAAHSSTPLTQATW